MTDYRNALANSFNLCLTGDLNPLIADRIPLSEARRAHEFLEQGKYAGKVVLVADD